MAGKNIAIVSFFISKFQTEYMGEGEVLNVSATSVCVCMLYCCTPSRKYV